MPGFLYISTTDSEIVARVLFKRDRPCRCQLSPVVLRLKLEIKTERKGKVWNSKSEERVLRVVQTWYCGSWAVRPSDDQLRKYEAVRRRSWIVNYSWYDWCICFCTWQAKTKRRFDWKKNQVVEHLRRWYAAQEKWYAERRSMACFTRSTNIFHISRELPTNKDDIIPWINQSICALGSKGSPWPLGRRAAVQGT